MWFSCSFVCQAVWGCILDILNIYVIKFWSFQKSYVEYSYSCYTRQSNFSSHKFSSISLDYISNVSYISKSFHGHLYLSHLCLPTPILYLGVVYLTVQFLKSMVCFLWSGPCIYSFWLSLRITTNPCGCFPELCFVCDLLRTFWFPKGSPFFGPPNKSLVVFYPSLPHPSPKCTLVWSQGGQKQWGFSFPRGNTDLPSDAKSYLPQSFGLLYILRIFLLVPAFVLYCLEAGVWENRKKKQKGEGSMLSLSVRRSLFYPTVQN